jgi:hypothetical protein
VSKSKKISNIDKVYVVNLTRNDIWLISDALRHMKRLKSPREKQIKTLLSDFQKFESKISEYLNEEIKNGTKDSKM